MSLQEKLLNPKPAKPEVISIFGGKFPVAKMTTAELSKVDKKMTELRDKSDADEITLYTASVILDSMVDEKGKKMSTSVEPSALLDLYDPGAINDALNALYKVNYAGLDGAEAAKKD